MNLEVQRNAEEVPIKLTTLKSHTTYPMCSMTLSISNHNFTTSRSLIKSSYPKTEKRLSSSNTETTFLFL